MHTHGHSQTPNNALHTGNTDGPCTYRVRHVRICIMWCMRRREFYFELDWVLQVGEFPKLFRHFRGQRCIVCFQRERTPPPSTSNYSSHLFTVSCIGSSQMLSPCPWCVCVWKLSVYRWSRRQPCWILLPAKVPISLLSLLPQLPYLSAKREYDR